MMNDKLLEMAELAGFDTNKGFVTVFDKQYLSISNHDISDKLTRFYQLARAETREQLNVAIDAMEHKAIKKSKEEQVKYSIAKKALEKIGE